MRGGRAAVVQRPPALLDRDAGIAGVVAALDETAAAGAQLTVFPETFVPGYPTWIWRMAPGPDGKLTEAVHAQLISSAVDLSSTDLDPVRAAAARHGMTVVLGVHERDHEFSRTTLYNTLVVIGPDGELLNRHRKLMPTNPERMVWAPGDASGLRVVDTPVGRLGGLICWENYLPLARYALYAQGEEVHVAPTWDRGGTWIASMRHIAAEGRCWVLGAGCSMQARDVPAGFPDRDRLFPDPDEWLNAGDSVIVAPDGRIVAGPLKREHGVLYADLDLDTVAANRMTFDAAGHYARPDVFSLHVDRRPRSFVELDDGPS